MSLTETGEQPLPHAVATLDAGIRAVEAAPRAERATLRASGLSGTAMVPAAGETMRRFTQRHPDIELVVSNPGLNQPAGGAQ